MIVPMAAVDNQERRETTRQRVLKEARIVLHEDLSLIRCVLRDVSEGGAKLEVPPTTELPSTFRLLMVSDNLIVPVRLAWRKGGLAGVTFLEEPRRAPPRKW